MLLSLSHNSLSSSFPTEALLNGSEKEEWRGKKAILLSGRWQMENSSSTSTSTSMKWVSRGVPRRHSKKSRNFPWRRRGTPEIPLTPRLNKAIWVKGIKNVPCHIQMQFSRNTMRMTIHTESHIAGYLCTCHHCQKSTDS